MKRKRNQTDEGGQNGNDGKKYRIYENEPEKQNEIFDLSMESKTEDFVLTREIAEHEILSDISGNKWRIGVPIGKGSFGEIFLASDDITRPVNGKNSNFVIKIEPHSNGPLFVEIHCLLNVNKSNSSDSGNVLQMQSPEDIGIPKYVASGSHYFLNSRYRFLIMPRYKTDLHSILKCGRLSQRHFLIVASQIIDVLKNLHEKQYVHSDIKAENIMIGLCKPSQLKKVNAFKQNSVQARENKVFGMTGLLSNFKRNLRPSKKVAYIVDENSKSSNSTGSINSDENDSEQDEDFVFSPKKKKVRKVLKRRKYNKPLTKLHHHKFGKILSNDESDERIYVIDYGLATKYMNYSEKTTVHKPFCCDERRAHDGTLEYTSRDAHFGAHSRRSDLECLGYNLIYWSQGFLPWKDEKLKEQPEIVHRLKEIFMTDVKEVLKLLYGKDVPSYLGNFMDYVGHLEFDEEPDYKYLKGLFEKEYIKLGFKKNNMKLNLNEMREECEKISKSATENELMLSKITDISTARKLGFLIATDSVDGTEIQAKSNEKMAFNISSKASPKNLRSKEKSKGKRPKRHFRITEKEQIIEKMTQGKKITLAELALIDPEQFARARADREYERSDEKSLYQTPQKYNGNPTYAILEIENRLKLRQSRSAATVSVFNGDSEPIKGYTKQMMDILRKQQLLLEKQIFTPQTKRYREKITNAVQPSKRHSLPKIIKIQKIKPTRKYKTNKATKNKCKKQIEVTNDKTKNLENDIEIKSKKSRTIRSKRASQKSKNKTESSSRLENDLTSKDVENDDKQVKRKRGRPKTLKCIIETPDTEEDSVYYDIPGEGSNYDIKAISEDENAPTISQKLHRNDSCSSDDVSNGDSVNSESSKNKRRKHKGRYYADDDYDVSDDISNLSTISNTSEQLKTKQNRKQTFNNVKLTRNKLKSRSSSLTAPVFTEESDPTECSELSETDYELHSGDESEEVSIMDYDQSETEEEENESDVDDDSNDSIDFKYSPITKLRQTRRNDNVKTSRGGRINVIDESVRNFRLISTQG